MGGGPERLPAAAAAPDADRPPGRLGGPGPPPSDALDGTVRAMAAAGDIPYPRKRGPRKETRAFRLTRPGVLPHAGRDPRPRGRHTPEDATMPTPAIVNTNLRLDDVERRLAALYGWDRERARSALRRLHDAGVVSWPFCDRDADGVSVFADLCARLGDTAAALAALLAPATVDPKGGAGLDALEAAARALFDDVSDSVYAETGRRQTWEQAIGGPGGDILRNVYLERARRVVEAHGAAAAAQANKPTKIVDYIRRLV